MNNQNNLFPLSQDQKIIDYIFGGNALITVRNEDSKNRFTFKIKKCKNPKAIKIDLYWVLVLTMPDNNDEKSYKFIGALSREEGFRHSDKSYIKDNAKSVNVAYYYFNRLLGYSKFKLHDNIRTYHMGYCGRCGRLLTVPESIDSGFGPECSTLLNIPHEVREAEFKNTLFEQNYRGTEDYQIK